MKVEIVERARPRTLAGPATTVAAILTTVGIATFISGLAVDAATAWRAFHVNYIYFAGLAQGGIVLAAVLVIVGATWAGPVRRVMEALGAWVPVTLILGVVGIAGRHHIYSWMEHPIAIKAAWLNPARMYLVDIGVLIVLTALSYAWVRISTRPTLRGSLDGSDGFSRAMIERWTSDWRGEEEEQALALKRLRILAPIICLVYAFGYSIIGFDQVMSLSPMWFSNLFGAFFAWGGFLSAVSVTTVLCVLHRNSPGFKGQITPSRLHDLGKMIFAFSIFWMYLFFSQYLVIWYGNFPEETFFIEARLGTEFLQSTWGWDGWWDRIAEPYVRLSLLAWVCVWFVPFWFLLGQRPKRAARFVGTIAFVSAFGFWLERNVLIWPSLVPGDTLAPFGWIQIGVACGFLGAFVLVFLVFSRVFPSLAVPSEK